MARLAKTSARKRIIALLSTFVGIAGIITIGTSSVWGVGIYEENTPYKSAQLLKHFAAQGNILNFFHLGGYLAWELGRPVFVDGNTVYEAVEIHDAIFRADTGWQNVIQLFNIQAIVTPVTLGFSGQIIPLLTVLENDSNWILVGQEKAGLIFVRNTGQEGIVPLSKEVIWHQAIEELDDTVKLYPKSKEAYLSLATAYGHIGDTAKQQYYSEKHLSLPN